MFNTTAMKIISMLFRFSSSVLTLSLSAIGALSHPLDTWHTRQPAGDGYLQGVCYGNNRFVAVGMSGTVVTSVTGEIWSPQTSGTIADLENVTWGNGLFVTVGASGTILTSPDGTNWTARSSGVSNLFWSVGFGNGVFVTVAYHCLLTSENGISWSPQTPDLPFLSAFVAHGNGMFVLGGEVGTNIISTDGTNWFARPSGTDEALYTMGFGNGVFLSIDHQLRTFISSDASNWVQRTSVTAMRPPAVAFGNGYFVTGSYRMEYSRDGNVWAKAPVACSPRGICFGNGTFVAVGVGQTIVQSDPVVWLGSGAPGTVEISGTVGRMYRIESADALMGSQAWVTRTNFTLMTSHHLWSDPEHPAHPQRLYRVVIHR